MKTVGAPATDPRRPPERRHGDRCNHDNRGDRGDYGDR